MSGNPDCGATRSIASHFAMKRVVIGLLGTKLDSGTDVRRWDFWLPTVSLFQHEDLLWDRLELLAEPNFYRNSEEEDEVSPRMVTFFGVLSIIS